MFINRYLAAFARGHGGKITVTCFLQLILTLLGTMISLGVAFVVRMLQGEARILFFSELWQVFAAIGICIALRYALSRKKMLAAEQCSLGIKASLRDGFCANSLLLAPPIPGGNARAILPLRSPARWNTSTNTTRSICPPPYLP